MLTEEQEKALLEEIDKLRQDKAALISRVASLEQSLYWLRKKVFGRMSEKNLPLDPNQLFLFSKEEMSSMEISRMEDEVRKSDEEITRTIKVKEKPSRKPLDTSSLPVEVVDLYPEGTTDGEGRLKDDFIEIGKEESSRLERVPAKVYILKIGTCTIHRDKLSTLSLTIRSPGRLTRSLCPFSLHLSPPSWSMPSGAISENS